MTFLILIISYCFAWSPKDIVDGPTHRYYGLYSNMARIVLRYGGATYWYSVRERKLLKIFNGKAYLSRHSMLTAVVKALKDAFTFGKPVIVILDYPHSFLGVKHLVTYLSTLLMLHVFRLIGAVFVAVDNMDPPIEHAIELKGKISLLERLLWLLLNGLIFRFNVIIFHSKSYKIYHKLYYKTSYDTAVVIPPGSFPDMIPYIEPMPEAHVNILLSGRIHEWIGLAKIIELIKALKCKGIRIKFTVLDKSAPTSLKEEDIKVVNTYVNYFDFLKLLTESHILLLIRPKSLHHTLTVRATIADYMMAGRPIIYLDSLGIREVVSHIRGCYSFKSLEEIPIILQKLTGDTLSLSKLSRGIRLYAEEYLDYRKLALNLLREVMKRIYNRKGV